MRNSNALRLWGFTLFALTLCLLALLIQDQVTTIKPVNTDFVVPTSVVETTTTTTMPDLSFLNTTTTTAAPRVSTPQAVPQSTEAFFECIRHRESRGNYEAVNSTGTFMGAYQFYQGGWNTFAARIDRHDLVGVPPHTASPADQDAVALAAYNELGSKPWGGACG
jgi:muramidase (phage lysozyme)